MSFACQSRHDRALKRRTNQTGVLRRGVALLHTSDAGRSFPFIGQRCPTTSLACMPRVVRPPHSVGIIVLSSVEHFRWRPRQQQCRSTRMVADLAFGQKQSAGPTPCVEGVYNFALGLALTRLPLPPNLWSRASTCRRGNEHLDRLLTFLDIERWGKSSTLRVETGPGYIREKQLKWAEKQRVAIQHIQPG